tara:strand:+ start:3665 stop:5434 length:1770 start_codon:yes stop_codon:yes gene_type:complete
MKIIDIFDNNSEVFVIGEIAGAHEGQIGKMKKLIGFAKDAKCDAVKVQIFRSTQLVVKHHHKRASFEEKEFSRKEWLEISEHARKLSIPIFVDVFDGESLSIAEEMGAEAYKIHSTVISDPFLLEDLAKTKKPIFISTGGSSQKEVRTAFDLLNKGGCKLILMPGFQSFPTKIEDSNLNLIELIGNNFGCPVGYADHCDAEKEIAMTLPLLAVACGARVIEKHFTENRSLKGTDHYSSLNPGELSKLVKNLKDLPMIFGRSDFDNFSDDEKNYRINMKKYIVASSDISVGEKFSIDNLTFKRTPNVGLDASSINHLLGQRASRNFNEDETIEFDFSNPKVAILIAARLASSRLPKKVLKKIGNQTIIEHLIDRMKSCKNVDEVILCTSTHPDDKELLKYADEKGISHFQGDPDDVMKRFLGAIEGKNFDIIVRVTGDNPLTSPEFIDSAIEKHIRNGVDYTSTVELPRGTKGEIISVSALQRAFDLAEDSSYSEYMTWYFTDNPWAFGIQDADVPTELKRPKYRFTIDTKEDLDLVSNIYDALHKPGKIIPLRDAIKYVDENPDLIKINESVRVKNVKNNVNVRLKQTD